jgi:hypothetical protein
MRRVTPRGGAKPWRTRENIETVERVAAAGVTAEELEDYVRGCAEVVSAGQESAIYWSVRQLFTSPTVDWWRGKVAGLQHERELAAERDLEKKAQRERERLEREARRSAMAASTEPVDLEVRRAAEGLRAQVVQRARAQELAASVVARLGGADTGGGPCPRCSVPVAGGEARCPACGSALVDERGQRRAGLRRA